VVVTSPGLRVIVHVPVDGKPVSLTLPVATAHVGCVIVPITGGEGMLFTLIEKGEVAVSQGVPSGLFVDTVIITVLSASPAAGV
jgi:hypothetical protein